MEVPSEELEDMAIPLNSRYGGHIIHHHDHMMRNNTCRVDDEEDDLGSSKKKQEVIISYRECLKNHAAGMGGNSTDGCGEFMPSGQQGTLEALTCSACGCHRNFHRKHVQEAGRHHSSSSSHYININNQTKLLLHHRHYNPADAFVAAPPPVIVPNDYNIVMGLQGATSDDQSAEGNGGRGGMSMTERQPHQVVKKRFRTKFSQEQKEKMRKFAEKVGWKLQKQDESVVQHFCQEIGVKRRVLKVWMHNNKHHFASNANQV